MKTKKIEVLAPAGNPAALKAAGVQQAEFEKAELYEKQGIGGEFFA